jgi:hypothetical protein
MCFFNYFRNYSNFFFGYFKIGFLINNMNSNILTTNNINNEQWQYCKGCEKNWPSSLFTTNGKLYRTCNTCRLQNKAVYQRKLIQKQQDNAVDPIEFSDFNDFMAELFEKVTNDNENQENLEFKFSCTVNITGLEGDFKGRAEHIKKIISDVDEYMWM